jgi:hypothetical protein
MSKWINSRGITCKCGARLGANDIKVPLLGMATALGKYEDNFYGGIVTHFSRITHSCGEDVMLYLKQAGDGYAVHDVAFLDKPSAPVAQKQEDVKEILDKDDSKVNNEEEESEQAFVDVKPVPYELQFVTSFLAGNLEDAVKAFDKVPFLKCADVLAEVGFDKDTEILNKGKNQSMAKYVELIKSRLA